MSDNEEANGAAPSADVAYTQVADAEGDDIARFVAVTNCPPEQAQFFLQAAGSFERAVTLFFEQAGPQPAQEPFVSQLPPRPAAPVTPTAGGQVATGHAAFGPGPRHRRGGLLQRLLAVPAAVVQTSLSLALGVLHVGVSLVGFVAHRTLPPPVLRRLQGTAQALSQGETEVDPRTAASTFRRAFAAHYGDRHPDWADSGWQDASVAAARQYKFLLVYLHAAEHNDTPTFCRETLTAPEVVDHISQNYVAWGGDIRFSDTYRLSNSVRATQFPFVGLLAFSGSRTRLVLAVQGPLGPAEMVQALSHAAEAHGAEFVADRADASARDYNRRLREEQDAEFQRSLEADRQREAEAAAEADRQAAAAHEAAQAESEARARQEAAAAAAAEAAAALQRRKHEAALWQATVPEPPAGTPDTSLVRVRLPSGTNFQRRFQAGDTLQAVFDFADAQEDNSAAAYSLASNFPRRVFTASEHGGALLSELGLAPQALLFVQPADDD